MMKVKPYAYYSLTIVFYLFWHVIVHYMLNSWEIQTLGGNIGGH